MHYKLIEIYYKNYKQSTTIHISHICIVSMNTDVKSKKIAFQIILAYSLISRNEYLNTIYMTLLKRYQDTALMVKCEPN